MNNVINIEPKPKTDREKAAQSLIDLVGPEHALAVKVAVSVAYAEGLKDATNFTGGAA